MDSVVLASCLKTIRNFILNLLESQFNTYQIQPLLEISNMIRMKVMANATAKSTESKLLLNILIKIDLAQVL